MNYLLTNPYIGIIIGILLTIFPFTLSYIFYKKYLNKIKPNFKITNFKIFLESFFPTILSGIVGSILKNFINNSLIGLLIIIIIYYLILKLILSKKEGFTKEEINKIASNTTGAVFGIIILTSFIITILLTYIVFQEL